MLVDDGTGCVPCILWTNQASFTARTLVEGLGLQARQELANGKAAKVRWNPFARFLTLNLALNLASLHILDPSKIDWWFGR